MIHVLLITLCDRGALGARHLSAALKRAGHRVSMAYFKEYRNVPRARAHPGAGDVTHESVDLAGRDVAMGISTPATAREREILCDLAAELRPDLIGFSTRSVTMQTAADLTRDLRRRFSATPIVWGGIGPTLEPEKSLESCDLVVVGEGEGTLLDLARAIDERTPWDGIANLWGNAREGRPAFRNPLRPLIRDLDSLPPADMSPEGKYLIDDDRLVRNDPAISNFDRLYELASSRGCPFSCTYCCNEILHRLYPGQPPVRRRGVAHVIAELREAVRSHRIERVNFQDDVFTMNPKWLMEFAEAYGREIRVPFWCYVHPEGLKREALAALRKAGMKWATLGIQSGSARILEDVYDRKAQREAVIETARALIGLGIDLNVDIITNNPLETREDCAQTLRLLADLPRGTRINAGLSKLSVFPRTRIAGLLAGAPDLSHVEKAVRESYNLLYLLSRQRFSPRGLVLVLSRREWLMRRPALLRPLLWPSRATTRLRRVARALPRLAKSVMPAWVWDRLKTMKEESRTGVSPVGGRE